jgi:hypothetical protein
MRGGHGDTAGRAIRVSETVYECGVVERFAVWGIGQDGVTTSRVKLVEVTLTAGLIIPTIQLDVIEGFPAVVADINIWPLKVISVVVGGGYYVRRVLWVDRDVLLVLGSTALGPVDVRDKRVVNDGVDVRGGERSIDARRSLVAMLNGALRHRENSELGWATAAFS